MLTWRRAALAIDDYRRLAIALVVLAAIVIGAALIAVAVLRVVAAALCPVPRAGARGSHRGRSPTDSRPALRLIGGKLGDMLDAVQLPS